jgi:hypothetical protein
MRVQQLVPEMAQKMGQVGLPDCITCHQAVAATTEGECAFCDGSSSRQSGINRNQPG